MGKTKMQTDYYVREYRKEQNDIFLNATLAGLGKNKNTWDCAHSKSAAYRHAKIMRAKYPQMVYKVETLC